MTIKVLKSTTLQISLKRSSYNQIIKIMDANGFKNNYTPVTLYKSLWVYPKVYFAEEVQTLREALLTLKTGSLTTLQFIVED